MKLKRAIFFVLLWSSLTFNQVNAKTDEIIHNDTPKSSIGNFLKNNMSLQ